MHQFLYEMANPIGIFGVILILVSYFCLSTGRWMADSYSFQLLNFSGAWLILYSLFFHWNLSSVIIEFAWIIISVMGMVRVFRNSKKKSRV